MLERSGHETARRFASDLRDLREARDVSLNQLQEQTRIPLEVLKDFESTGLVDNRMFNRVYLRSLVRSYADVLTLDKDFVLAALDEALEDRYTGSLQRIGAPAEELSDAAEEDEAEVAASTYDEVLEPTVPVSPVQMEVPLPTPAPPRAPVEPLRRETPPVVPVNTPIRPPTAWDAVSGSGRPPEPSPNRWALPLIGVVLLALVAGGIWWWLSRNPAPEQPAPVAVADTTQTAPVDTARSVTPVELPETLTLRLTATGGPLQGIRVRVDEDLRRPYWLEEGQSRDFPFRDSIFVEQGLERAAIAVEGVSYPTSRVDAQGRVALRRPDVQALLQNRPD